MDGFYTFLLLFALLKQYTKDSTGTYPASEVFMTDYLLNLQLFADDGGSSGVIGSDAGNNGAGNTTTTETDDTNTDDRSERYKQFRKEFDKEFGAEVQGLMTKRFKKIDAERQKSKEYKDKTSSVLEALSVKYNVNADDIDAIKAAVDKDNSYYEDAAYERGIPVDEFKRVKGIENENRRLNLERQQTQDEMRRARFEQRLNQEISVTQASYPQFNIRQEAENPQFTRLVESGVPVKTAFEIVHHEEIAEQIRRQAASEVAQKMRIDANSNAKRPKDNIQGSGGAVSFATSVSKLTNERMDDIKARVMRGEKIDFKNNF